MSLKKDQEKFIDLYSFEQLRYSEIEVKTGWTRKYIQDLRRSVAEQIDEIQKVRTKFTKIRREGFEKNNKSFKDFHSWYEKQSHECGYCGVTQKELQRLFENSENRVLPFLEKDRVYKKLPKRASGTLEIERLDSAKEYGYGDNHNIILACPLCNNAKSNLIDQDSWKELFVPAMQAYYKKLFAELCINGNLKV